MRIRIYTDGACSGNPGAGGWAYVMNTDTSTIEDKGGFAETTNNRMELYAVLKVLERIESEFTNKDVFDIHSDSAYVVNAINNKWTYSWKMKGWKTSSGGEVKNKDIWSHVHNKLESLKIKEYEVNFIKVKGHSGNTFNELVDKLAREQALRMK